MSEPLVFCRAVPIGAVSVLAVFKGAIVLALGLALLFGAVKPARAEEARDAMLRAAIAAKESALESNDVTLWQEALRLFLQLDAQAPSKEAKYEVGSAAAELGAVGLAYDYFEQALLLGLSGPAKEKALAYTARQRSTLGFISVEGDEGAVISIDGQLRGTLPLARPLAVSPGPRRLHATLPSGQQLQREVRLSAGQTLTLTLVEETKPQAAAPPAPVRTNSGAPTLRLGASPGGELVRVEDGAMPAPAEPTDAMGVGLLIVGGVVFTSSALLLPLSFGELGARRDALRGVCHTQSSPDQCERPNAGQSEAAQGHVDAIATWSVVRGGAVAGLVVGAALGTWGLLSLNSDESGSELSLTVLPNGGALTQARVRF
jgi:hypothetical protein